jgi:hypothetical protein
MASGLPLSRVGETHQHAAEDGGYDPPYKRNATTERINPLDRMRRSTWSFSASEPDVRASKFRGHLAARRSWPVYGWLGKRRI